MKGELLIKIFGFLVPEENLFLPGVYTAYYFNGWRNKQMLVSKFYILVENSPPPQPAPTLLPP